MRGALDDAIGGQGPVTCVPGSVSGGVHNSNLSSEREVPHIVFGSLRNAASSTTPSALGSVLHFQFRSLMLPARFRRSFGRRKDLLHLRSWQAKAPAPLLCAVLAMLLPVSLFAAIDGTVVNRTTGKPQPGISITLVKPGAQGMQTIGTTESDAQGRFRFEKDQPGGAPQLLQATHSGVTYNKLLTPNIPTSGVEVDVYDATKSASVAEMALHLIVMEASESQLTVNEVITLRNQSNVTYEDAEQGGLRFFLPPATNGQVKVQVKGPQGMPLPRAAEPTGQRNVFKVSYPIRPGETEFNLSYVIPVGSPTTYTSRVITLKGQPVPGPVRFVVPQGVTLEGKDLTSLGQEPTTQASIYNLRATGDYSIQVTGTGSLHGPETEAGGESEAPQIEQAHPRLYDYLPWLLTLSFAILAIGLVLLYRISPVVEQKKR